MIYWGTNRAPVVFLEVIPIIWKENHDHVDISMSNYAVKHFLQKKTSKIPLSVDDRLESIIKIEWPDTSDKVHEEKRDVTASGKRDFPLEQRLVMGYLWEGQAAPRLLLNESSALQGSIPIFYLPSNNPAVLDPIPCILKGYISESLLSSTNAKITSATLVRILPPQFAVLASAMNGPSSIPSFGRSSTSIFHQLLLGETGQGFLSPTLQEEVLSNHNPEAIRELALRMSIQCSRRVQIGTTKDAFQLKKLAVTRSQQMQKVISFRLQISHDASPLSVTTIPNESTSRANSKESSLLVHSPNHADGKTMLVQAIAQTIGCSRIHIIRPGPLLAKYGVQADTALESLLHGILVSAATLTSPICIILDTIDAMMPPQLSGRSGTGDAAVPVFNSIASYFRNVALSMQKSNEFPFPVKNAMYNVGGSGGTVLSVRFCLVGVVTCPDDGWRSLRRGGSNSVLTSYGSATILDALVGGRYRLPTLTAKTRWSAFSKAFERSGIVLDDKAQKRLVTLAASSAWAKGSSFQRIADLLVRQQDNTHNGLETVSVQHLEEAFASGQSNSATFAHVSVQVSKDSKSDIKDDDDDDLFASVGGNMKAKRSLEDALALDPEKRAMLARFGLSPPTGILLYGPPGCGKTLLAKAVARLLKTPAGKHNDDTLPLGGTFIALGSSDLVRAEIGTSEKMLVSAFNFADKNAPSVVFLDEFQALFVERSRGGSGKLASTLLQCMDDVKRWKFSDKSPSNQATSGNDGLISSRVVVLGATNTPWMIDSAFLRPGRFDRVVYVGLPTLNERQSILNVHASRMKIRVKDESTLQALCHTVAEHTNGFSGADLAALCRAAAIHALADGNDDCWVEERHFLLALDSDVRASSDSMLVERLLKWKP